MIKFKLMNVLDVKKYVILINQKIVLFKIIHKHIIPVWLIIMLTNNKKFA